MMEPYDRIKDWKSIYCGKSNLWYSHQRWFKYSCYGNLLMMEHYGLKERLNISTTGAQSVGIGYLTAVKPSTSIHERLLMLMMLL